MVDKASDPSADLSRGSYHIREAKPGTGVSFHPCTIAVGDPVRAQIIANEFLDDAELVAHHRGFDFYNGTYDDTPITVISHGIGGGSAGTYLKEAILLGSRYIIRVGTCSTLDPNVPLGAVGIVSGAVPLDQTVYNWVMPGFPCFADDRVMHWLRYYAHNERLDHVVGIGATTDCFDEGQGRLNPDGWILSHLRARHEDVIRLGVSFYEMEAATLFGLVRSNRFDIPADQLMAGCVLSVYGNRDKDTDTFIPEEDKVDAQRHAATVALKTLHKLWEHYPISR